MEGITLRLPLVQTADFQRQRADRDSAKVVLGTSVPILGNLLTIFPRIIDYIYSA